MSSIKVKYKTNTISMNSKNSETPDPHRPLLNLSNKIDLKRKDKYVALSNLSIYFTQKNIKMSHKNHRFKILPPTWNDKFDSPDGSYSAPHIQDYFEYIIKRYETVTDNPSVRIYVNKIEERTACIIKTSN